MTWTRLSDDFADRPDILPLSDGAFRLHVQALIWCNRALTDGRMPGAVLMRIAPNGPARVFEYASELVQAGVWSPDGMDYLIDWRDQETAEAVKGRQERNRAKQEAFRLRRDRHASGDHSLCDPRFCPNRSPNRLRDRSHDGLVTDTRPVPSRRDRDRERGPGPDAGASAPCAVCGHVTAEACAHAQTLVAPEHRNSHEYSPTNRPTKETR